MPPETQDQTTTQSPAPTPSGASGTTPSSTTQSPPASGAQSPPTGSSSQTTTPATSQPATQPPTSGSDASTRPEWMPEKFWRDDKPDYQELAKSYRELERAKFTRREDIKREVLTELEASRLEKAPKAPGDYQLRERKAPDGTVLTFNTEDPAYQFLAHEAHRFGLDHEQFNDVLDRWIEVDAARGPDWEKEKQQLGENADLRRSRIATWANQVMTPDSYKIFSSIPASAGMVQLFENLMELAGQPGFVASQTAEGNTTYAQGVASRAELQAAMNDPKYWRDKDPAQIAKVKSMSRAIAAAEQRRP